MDNNNNDRIRNSTPNFLNSFEYLLYTYRVFCSWKVTNLSFFGVQISVFLSAGQLWLILINWNVAKLKQLFLIINVTGNCEKWTNDISHLLCFLNHIHTVLSKSNRIKKLAVFLPVKHVIKPAGPVTPVPSMRQT